MNVVPRLNSGLRRIPPWLLYAGTALWAAWMFWRAIDGQLGPEPVEVLEHEYGALALKMLVLGLAVTPLRRHVGLSLMPFRRAIGVAAFFLVLAHLLVWAVLDVQSLDRVWADILKRPYVTIGMAAFLLLLPPALTSNDLSVRRLGPRWRHLHKLVYPAAILAALHFVWLAKGFQLEPLLWLGVILVLLATRVRIRPRDSRRTA